MAAPTDLGLEHDVRLRAGRLALVGGIAVLLAKFAAWRITDSTAVLSDALESFVNVAAGALLLASLYLSAQPADRNHPYGHGKVEFFSAGVEGTLIAIAAVMIGVTAVEHLLTGVELRSLDLGLALIVLATLANAAIGWHLIRVGRRVNSLALVADGRHLFTDVVYQRRCRDRPRIGVGHGDRDSRSDRRADRGTADPADGLEARAPGDRRPDGRGGSRLARSDGRRAGVATRAGVDRRAQSAFVAFRCSGARRSASRGAALLRRRSAPRHQRAHRARPARRDPASRRGDHALRPCRPRYCPFCKVDPCPVRESPFVAARPLTFDRATRSDEALDSGRAVANVKVGE